MPHEVFISHSTKDKPAADEVCAALEERNIRCWIAPRDIMPGADWSASIVQAIRGSRIVLLILSAHANASAQIKREVECASNAGATLVPLRIEEVMPNASLEYFLCNIQWLDAAAPPLKDHLPSVVERIEGMLAGAPDQTATRDPRGTAITERGPSSRNVSHLPRRAAWVVAAGVTVAGLVTAGWRFSQRGRKSQDLTSTLVSTATTRAGALQTPPSPPPTTAELLVDPATVGLWDFTTNVGEHQLHIHFTFHASGKYDRREFIQSDEKLTAEDGKYTSTNAVTGVVNSGTYRFVDADTLTMTGSVLSNAPGANFLTHTYRRSGTRRGENPIVGTWNATTFAFGLNWQVQAEIRPDLSSRFLMESREEGAIRMADGKWEAVPLGSERKVTGVYRNVTPTSMEMNVAGFGIVTLRRLADRG
jgi:hypothetical protein